MEVLWLRTDVLRLEDKLIDHNVRSDTLQLRWPMQLIVRAKHGCRPSAHYPHMNCTTPNQSLDQPLAVASPI